MGEYAEERAVMMGLDEVYEDIDFKYWTMRDGTKIKITDMTDSHLINTIKMLERNYNKLMLSMFSPYPNLYPNLINEAKKRKLI